MGWPSHTLPELEMDIAMKDDPAQITGTTEQKQITKINSSNSVRHVDFTEIYVITYIYVNKKKKVDRSSVHT